MFIRCHKKLQTQCTVYAKRSKVASSLNWECPFTLSSYNLSSYSRQMFYCFLYFLTDCGFVWIKIAVYYKIVVEYKLLSLKNNDHYECLSFGESADEKKIAIDVGFIL